MENEELAKRYDVKAFPTLKYFRNGKPVEYKGGRSAAEIAAWAYRKIEPKSTTLKSTEDLEKFQAKNELFTLGVFKSLDSEAAVAFKDLADDDEVHLYAITAHEEIKNKLFYPRTIGDKEFVIVFKPFDELRADLALTGKFSTDKVSNFVKYQSTPPVQEFSAATMRRIAASPIKHHVLFFTHKEAEHHATAMQVYYEVSVEFRNQALFVNVPSTEQQVLSYFKIESANLPAMVLIDFSDTSKGMKQFPYSGDLSVAEVSGFVSGVLEGNLEPAPTSSADEEKKGEKVSPQDTLGNVVVVKRDSYKEIVMESDNDVLLEFYAPWCGHCKNLGKTFCKMFSLHSVVYFVDVCQSHKDSLFIAVFICVKVLTVISILSYLLVSIDSACLGAAGCQNEDCTTLSDGCQDRPHRQRRGHYGCKCGGFPHDLVLPTRSEKQACFVLGCERSSVF